MKHKKLTPDTLIAHLRWPVAFFGSIYLVCMIAAPWIMGGGSWSYVQGVWDRWQGVNVGILAFAASFVAFEITRYNERRQRKREFLAVRAFLPEALSKLAGYLKDCARVHTDAWSNSTPVAFPKSPTQYKDIFANSIRHADAETGEQLAELLSDLLMWLQIHAARLEEFSNNPAHTTAMKRIKILDGLRLVGELQAKVNRLFPFARGMGELDTRPLTWEDYKTAYQNLGLHFEGLVVNGVSLESKTMSRIATSNAKAPRQSGDMSGSVDSARARE